MPDEIVRPRSYSSKAVANSLITLAQEHGEQLDHMKLQKLIYFAHGFYLAFYDVPLIDEVIEAWDYGPVIPSIYHEFKHFGANPIQRLAKAFNGEEFLSPLVDPNDDLANSFLQEVWRAYGEYSGIQLSNITHAVGTPWRNVRDKYDRNVLSAVIPNEEIKRYFKSQLEGNP